MSRHRGRTDFQEEILVKDDSSGVVDDLSDVCYSNEGEDTKNALRTFVIQMKITEKLPVITVTRLCLVKMS